MGFSRNLCFGVWLGFFTMSCANIQTLFPDREKKSINKIIRDLSFFPVNGERFRLSERQDKKAVVVVIRDKDCPISEKYGFRLAQLEEKYSKSGIQFIYSYVGQVKPMQNAKKDIKKFNFKAPYIIDIRQELINALGAQTTGEIFILTPERKIIYKGPFDNQFHAKSTSKLKIRYVSDILSDIVSGKAIIPKEIPVSGHIISRPMTKKRLFFEDVAPLIAKKCTICHNPSGTGFINYLNYEDIAGRHSMFRYVIERDLMPPWNVDPMTGPWANDISLSVKEKAMLLKWLDDGLPRKSKKVYSLWTEKQHEKDGDRAEPDYVIHLPEKVVVPAEGMNEYKTFAISTPFDEDKWIKEIHFVTKPKVIHHITLFIMDSLPSLIKRESMQLYLRTHSINWLSSIGNEAINLLDSYMKSKLEDIDFNEQIGLELPKKSKIALEVHYESIGQKVVDDFTHIQIYFHKKKPKYKIEVDFLNSYTINIPPLESNYKSKLSYKTKKTKQLIGLFPHMHLRGKASSIFLINPRGQKKRIFGIEPYLFNFQRLYIFKKPLNIEKNSILECALYYDNSTSNPVNPNPNKKISFGLRTIDEMSMCHLSFLVPSDSNGKFQWINVN